MKHWYLIFRILLLSLPSALVSANDINLPTIGTEANTRLSVEEEEQLGAAFMRSIRLHLPVSSDPEVIDYIWNLGFQLVSSSNFNTRPFYFFVVNESIINAFAGPGGYIGVNAGLILASRDEHELAGVIAHEIAHIAQRHLDRAFSAAEKLTLPTAAAIVAAILLGGKDINLAEAALAATLAANIQTQLNFTRKHELEADHIGMQILVASEFDPHAMPRFFERLQQQDRLYDDQLPEFLRTHPVTTNRIAESKDRASKYLLKPKSSDIQYQLIREKLRVANSTNPGKLVKFYSANKEAGIAEHRFAHDYGYALALHADGQFKKARNILNQLIKNDKERISYRVLLAQIEFADGNQALSEKIFHDAWQLYPRNRTVTQYYVEMLLASNQAAKAINLLKTQLDQRPSPVVFELLAKAEGENDRPGAALAMLAEYYFMFGQIHTAIEQLSLALRQKDVSASEANRIEQRIAELKRIAIIEKEFR
ncbi:MAG: M48 family metalloprotease [Gammaproteobacteria bacterium]|nr:M48 family metalloprotease [Gammaproteobacteria bacterium]